MKRFASQVAVVTGAAQGIGQQIALRLGEEGARLVIADINESGSHETAEMIIAAGGAKPEVVFVDVRCENQVSALIRGVLQTNGRIDILVNNTGIMGPVKRIEDISLEEWETTIAVNLTGMFLCCKHVIPAMKQQGKGSIVNMSSVTGKRPLPLRSPYAASKMAVIGLTRTLAAELGEWKIRVNCVCPGAVTGPRLDRVIEGIMEFTHRDRAQVAAERAENSPLKTFVDPRYVAGIVAFLCSEDAARITGQDVNVSAGAVMY
jgi:NAD(P)-dependent dehydrogenase (short-subunit alcohol dehydrogenase family)